MQPVDVIDATSVQAPEDKESQGSLDLVSLENAFNKLLMKNATQRHFVFRFCYNNSLIILVGLVLFQIIVRVFSSQIPAHSSASFNAA